MLDIAAIERFVDRKITTMNNNHGYILFILVDLS